MAKKPIYKIIHSDDDLLVINKAAGITVIQDRDGSQDIVLYNLLRESLDPNLLLVHRIDRNTSGIMIFAKNEEAQKKLSELFQLGQIEKRYFAIAEGLPKIEDWREINVPIFKRRNAIKVLIDPKGKKSLTRFRVVEHFKSAALLEVMLLTGRTHQIRVHLKHIGYPLLVDDLYGNRDAFYLSQLLGNKFKLSKFETERPLMSRHSLHAQSIRFKHPVSGEELFFEADTPKDWNAMLNQLRKHV